MTDSFTRSRGYLCPECHVSPIRFGTGYLCAECRTEYGREDLLPREV